MRPNDLHAAFDCDDVLLDFMGGLQRAIKTEYGVELPDFTAWEISEVLNPVLGEDWWEWLRRRDWLWPNFPAIDGAIGALDTLHRDGVYVEIITAKPDWARYCVSRWLGKWRPWYDRVTIVGLDDKKIDFTEADLIVDDKPSTCTEFAEDGRIGILFGRTHNVSAESELGVYRANSWADVVRLVRMEKEGELE